MAVLHATEVIDTQPSTVLAVVLGIVGTGLLLSAWVGRARGLILVGVLLVPVLSISTAADRIDLRGGFGERRIEPNSVSALQDTYRLGAGDFRLDLTGLDVDDQQDVPDIRVDQGVGRLRVFVPDEWSVDADVEVDFGEITLHENGEVVTTYDESDGLDRIIEFEGSEGAPSVELDLEMFAGVVEVHRELT